MMAKVGFYASRVRAAITASKRERATFKVFGDPKRYQDWVDRGCPPSPYLPPKGKSDPGIVLKKRIIQTFDKKLMERLFDLQKGKCFLCGEWIDRNDFVEARRASFDHVTPKCHGGRNHRNRLVAHIDCNGHKADRMPYACELFYLEVANDIIFVDMVG